VIADHHAAAAGRRLLFTVKTGGCAIPPIARHVFSRFLLSLSSISRRDSSTAVFDRDSQNSTFLHDCKVTDTDSGVRDLSFGSGWCVRASYGLPPQNAGFL
jgi:hypothetical protein